jgi:hypothetical protein
LLLLTAFLSCISQGAAGLLGREYLHSPPYNVLSAAAPGWSVTSEVSVLSPALPTRIGPYEVVDLLGQGSAGVVYRGLDSGADRVVAVQLMERCDPTLCDEFLSRTERTAILTHPNIVSVLDYGEHEGQPFIVTEFVDGSTVAAVIGQAGTLAVSQALQIIEAVCSGLDYAHQQGVWHLDLKPSSILIGPSGVVKIAGFGSAMLAKMSSDATGAFDYQSPEQIAGRPGDQRSDIFAAGVMLHEMLTGRRALDVGVPDAVTQAIAVGASAPVRTAPPRVDFALESIIQRAVQANPDDRFQTAGEMLALIGQARLRLGEKEAPLGAAQVARTLEEFEAEPRTRAIDAARAGAVKHARMSEAEPDMRGEPAASPSAGEWASVQSDTPDAAARKQPMQVVSVEELQLNVGAKGWAFESEETLPEDTPSELESESTAVETEEMAVATPAVVATPSVDAIPNLVIAPIVAAIPNVAIAPDVAAVPNAVVAPHIAAARNESAPLQRLGQRLARERAFVSGGIVFAAVLVFAVSFLLSSRFHAPPAKVAGAVVSERRAVGQEASQRTTIPGPGSDPTAGSKSAVDQRGLPASAAAGSQSSATGLLTIDAAPWGEVVKVVNSRGRQVQLGVQRFTPLTLSLPGDEYTVTVKDPSATVTRVFKVKVDQSQSGQAFIMFRTRDVTDYFKQAGWPDLQ